MPAVIFLTVVLAGFAFWRRSILSASLGEVIIAVFLGLLSGGAILGLMTAVQFFIWYIPGLAFLLGLRYWTEQRSRMLRFIGLTPAVLIRRGEVCQEGLKKSGFTLEKLMDSLREEGIPALADVEFAMLEPGGDLHIIRKLPPPENQASLLPVSQQTEDWPKDGEPAFDNNTIDFYTAKRAMEQKGRTPKR